PRAVDKMAENLKRGNLTQDQLFALVNYARSLPKESIHIETLPSFEGPSYVTVNPEKCAQVIQRMFYPNTTIALNIDAPDAGSVRSMKAPYERGRRGRRGEEKPAAAKTGAKPAQPGSGLSVEPPELPIRDITDPSTLGNKPDG